MATSYVVKDGTGASLSKSSTDVGAGVAADNVRIADATAANFMPIGKAASTTLYVRLNDGTNSNALAAASGALDETAVVGVRTQSSLSALDTAASSTAQLVPLVVQSTAAPNLRVGVFNGTAQQPAGDTVGHRVYVQHTDGTNSTPSMDAAARKAFVAVTDGTNTLPTGDAVARRIYVQHTDGTNSTPSMDAAARPGFQKITDGTHTMPSGDAVARPVFTKVTDGTNTMPTMDVIARPGFVTVTDATNTMPTMDAAARKGFVQVTDGTNNLPTGDAVARTLYANINDGTNIAAVKAASTGAALTDPAVVVALSPNSGFTKGSARDQGATVTAIKSSAGVLQSLTVVNAQASTLAYIQLWDTASGSVVVGTTAPVLEFVAQGASSFTFAGPFPFGTAISLASTTTEKGASGSAAGVQVFWTRS